MIIDMDNPDMLMVEEDRDVEHLRDLARRWYQLTKAGRGLARRAREAREESRTYMTETQACALLHVGRDAPRRFRRQPIDPLPALKIGRRYVYDPATVRRWAERAAERAARPRPRLVMVRARKWPSPTRPRGPSPRPAPRPLRSKNGGWSSRGGHRTLHHGHIIDPQQAHRLGSHP
jgi:hypothetical protein